MEKKYNNITAAIRKEIFGDLTLQDAAVEIRKLSIEDKEALKKDFKEEGIIIGYE